MIRVERFGHVGIVVRDLDRMIEFYTRVLGLSLKRTFVVDSEEFGRGVGIPGAKARGAHVTDVAGQVELELLQFLSDPEEKLTSATNVLGYGHIAFVVNDLEGSRNELEHAGVEVFSEPVTMTTPWNMAGFRFLYFRDFEGNIVELNKLPEGA